MSSQSEPIRILYVIGELAMGGAERHLVMTLPRLRELGFAPAVFTLVAKGELAASVEEAGVPVETVWGAGLLAQLPRMLRRLLGIPLTLASLVVRILARRPAVVHAFLPEAYVIGWMATRLASRARFVMSRRSLNRYQRGQPWLARAERWLHGRTDLLLGNSRAACAELVAEGAPATNVGLVYNGIEPWQDPATDGREAVRSELGIAPGTVVIEMTANLIAYKGHDDLVEALALLRHDIPQPWVLLCIGEDRGMGGELRRRAESLEVDRHIRWLGKRSDVPRLVAASDIGVLCSHQEGFSNAVLEGMNGGLAMVVTDVGGNPEAVINEESGLVVPALRPDLLAAALARLIADRGLRQRFGMAAQRRVRDCFSIRACAIEYQRLYRNLVER